MPRVIGLGFTGVWYRHVLLEHSKIRMMKCRTDEAGNFFSSHLEFADFLARRVNMEQGLKLNWTA